MIIARAPYRVSLFGGGTDYDKWFTQHGGAFLSLAMNKYCSAILKNNYGFETNKYTVSWRIVEEVSHVCDIKQPIVREAMRLMAYDDPAAFVYLGELPSQSGTGSSSSFAVAMVALLSHIKKQSMDKYELADKAYKIEHDLLRENIGVQDSIAASFGGLNFVEINKNGQYSVQKIYLRQEIETAFLDRMLLVYTQEQRLASNLAGEKLAVMDTKQQSFQTMQDMAYQAHHLLNTHQLDDFGRLLNELWHIKSQLNPYISTPKVEEIYQFAKDNGALGFKLLGAGGGGFTLLYFKEGMKQQAIKKLHNNTPYLNFTIDKKGVYVVQE